MPKLKTHKGTVKRMWKTGSGKILRRHAMRSHHRGRKSAKEKLRRSTVQQIPGVNPRLGELIPYNKP